MQTSYVEQASAVNGQIADSGHHDILSRQAEVAIPFGRLCTQGTAPDSQVKLPLSAASITTDNLPMGVAVSHHAMESSASGDPQYPINAQVNVLRKGRVWVKTEEAVTPASDVYVRFNNIAEQWTLVFSGDLVTSNVINGKVNGSAITPITFDTTHAATMALIETAVEAKSGVVSATIGGTGNRTLTVLFTDDTEGTLTDWVVTLGAGQVTATLTNTVQMHPLTEAGLFGDGAHNDEASAATCALLSPGAKYLSSTTAAGQLALLELDL